MQLFIKFIVYYIKILNRRFDEKRMDISFPINRGQNINH